MNAVNLKLIKRTDMRPVASTGPLSYGDLKFLSSLWLSEFGHASLEGGVAMHSGL